MFPQNEESVRNQDPKEKKVKSKFTAWRAYTFELQNILDTKSDPAFEFSPKNAQAMNSNPFIKIKAFKLYREKNQKPYMTPIIWLNNQRSTSPYILLYSHGNSSDLGTAYCTAMILSTIMEMDVVAYDYTGYGISPYKPSEKNLYSDIECVLSFIVNFMDFPLNKVILCGFSLGSGPTIELATRYQSLPFIVLFAPLASCLSIVEGEKGPEKVSSHDMFTNLEKMSKLSCDVVFIHGEKDRMIPSHHSSRMFARYIETHKDLKNTAWLLEVEGADHHQLIQELLDPTTEYRRSFMQYFEFLLGSNHTTKKKESFEILKLITEDDKSPQKEEDNISKKSDEIEKEKIHSENHENEEDRKNQGKMEVIEEEEKENKMIFQTEEPTKKALSPKDELLKLETSKLRLLFSKLVVNKPPSKNKNNKQKPNHNDMYKEAKVLI